jgi:hypothetical protein
MTWLFERLGRLPCVFRGHNSVFHFEPDHLSLRCLSCGYRTSGWNLGPDVGHTSSPVHDLSPQAMGNFAAPPVIVDETGGSAFAAHVARADRNVEASAATRPRARGDDRKSPVIRMAS